MAARPHILLVEDDVELGQQVASRLEQAGYQVTWWQKGRHPGEDDARGLQLVILDLMLPGTYGLDILKALREHSEVPVLVLSARNDASDKIRALQLGADDYLTKPFWPSELVERVRARLRRPRLDRAESDVVEAGGLRIDTVARTVALDGRAIALSPVEYEFLLALARRPGAALSRHWLAEHLLRDEDDVDKRTLDVHASRLRKKLGRAELIETVWGVGYRLATVREP
jgi:DNA-binding response OmpR family regulator